MLKASWKSLMGRKLRLVMSAMAIVLGVAFVAGSLIFTDMLASSFNTIVNGTLADINVQAKGQSEDFETQLTREIAPATVTKVAAVRGVASAHGTVSSQGTYLVGRDGKVLATQGAPAFGMNDVEAPAFGGAQGLHVVSGRAPQRTGEVAIDPSSLTKSGYHLGDTMKIVTNGPAGAVRARIVGTATWGSGGSAGATYAIFDTRTAQKYFLGGKDAYHGIWVTVDKGADLGAVTAAVAKVLPADLEAARGDELAKTANAAISQATGFISTFLLIFAAISLLVGTFLIVNTFSILVAQRSRELALLRALGASRAQVRRSVLFEAFVVGLVGSTLGLLAGIGIALAISALFATFGLDLTGTSITVAPRTVIVSYLVGMIVTMVAAYVPARRASSVPPVAAMTGDVTTGAAGLGRRAVVGTVLTALGLTALLAGLFLDYLSNRMWWVGAGAVLTLVGVAAASPVLGMPVTAALGAFYRRAFGAVGRLAHLNSVRNPRRTAATASALMIGLTFVTAMAVLGQSMKASVRDVITENMRGDYIVSSVSYGGFSPAVGDAMAKVDGVQAVHRMRYLPATLDGDRMALAALDRAGFDQVLAQHVVSGSLFAWRAGTVLVDEKTAAERHLKVGSTVNPVLNGTPTPLTVAALTSKDDALGGFITPIEGLRAPGLPVSDSMVSVTREPGADAAAVRAGLDRVVADMPMVNVTDQEQYADEQAKSVDQLLAIMYGLLALAIVIAVLGIVNTLGLSVVERTREIGLLRAIGLARPQLRRMVWLESIVIALLGSVLGIGMGLLFGVACQRALAAQGLERLAIPWPLVAVFVVVAIVVGILAAVWPAIRAARLDVLRAISTQ